MKCDLCKEYRWEIKELKKDLQRCSDKLWELKHLKSCGFCEKTKIGHWEDCKEFIIRKPFVSSEPPLTHSMNAWLERPA